MIITTRRSRAGYLFDLLLTAGGWFAFVYLFGAGILAILRGPPAGPETSLWAVFLPTANTLWGYAALALANGAALVAWALYNHRRFAGRTPPPAPPSATPSWRAASPSRPRSCSSCAAPASPSSIMATAARSSASNRPARSCAAWPEIASGPGPHGPGPLAATPLRRACPIFGSRIATTPSSGR